MFSPERMSSAQSSIETTPYESRVENLFEDSVVVINEGQKGVILFVEDGVYHKYIDDSHESGKDVAFKLLKVGVESELLQEVTVHKRAQKILQTSGVSSDDYAQIPEIVFERAAIHPRGKLLDWSKKNKIKNVDEKVLMFAMDFIPGKTIGEILLQETLRKHPRSPYRDGAGSLDSLQYSSLAAATEEVLGVHGNKDVLMDRTMEYLKQSGFVLPRKIASQISRTINLLNAAGVFHRDLHWGNIMVTDWGLPSVQAHIIDFGEGVISKDESTYENDQRGYISDALSAGRYTELSSDRTRIAQNLIKKMEKNSVWLSAIDDLSIAINLGEVALQQQMHRQWQKLGDRQLFLGLIQTVSDRNQDRRSVIVLACKRFASEIPLADANKVLDFLKSFEN